MLWKEYNCDTYGHAKQLWLEKLNEKWCSGGEVVLVAATVPIRKGGLKFCMCYDPYLGRIGLDKVLNFCVPHDIAGHFKPK